MSTNEGNVTRVTVELIITGAYRDDSGSYECSVSNLLNTVTGTVNLTVQCMYSGNVIVFLLHTAFKNSASILILCSIII